MYVCSQQELDTPHYAGVRKRTEINDSSLGKTFIYVHLSQQAGTGAICLKDIDDARGMK